jgi:hypothetical protein
LYIGFWHIPISLSDVSHNNNCYLIFWKPKAMRLR